MSVFDTEVRKLAEKHRDRIPVLKVMCQLAADAERVSGRPLFDAEAVRIHLGTTPPGNMSFFVNRGFVTANDESRQHRYYDMPAWREIELALRQLD
jgi:hypothetical protein